MTTEERTAMGCVKQHECKNFGVKCAECFETAGTDNHHPGYEHRDLVEVVRCKDCKHRIKSRWHKGYQCGNECDGMASGVELRDDDFCSYGERRMIMEKTCKNCGTPITKEYCEDNYPEVCEHWTPKKPKTNADRIRAMSDEELAEFFHKRPLCPKPKQCEYDCSICWLEWLKQPAEVEG